MNLKTVEFKAFVPARDFALSKAFYEALGFAIPWSDEDLAYVRHGDCAFLLQNFHEPAHTANFQMHMPGPAHTTSARCVVDQKGHAQGALRRQGGPPAEQGQRCARPFWPQPFGNRSAGPACCVALLARIDIRAAQHALPASPGARFALAEVV